VRYLAETVGPRGSTTPKEAEAAAYAKQVLEGLGLAPKVETFTSAKSAWWPYVLVTGVALIAEGVFLIGGRVGAIIAALLAAGMLISTILELSFNPNPLRWALPKGQSQNVWAVVPAAGQIKHRVVLMGHLDTHRTPLVFSSQRWVALFNLLIPLGLLGIVLNGILYGIGAVSDDSLWRIVSLVPSALILGIFALTLQADFSPYTAGANDNATGVGAVLSLAARLKREPLRRTEVWLVCSGCEEVACYGAADFVRRHRAELADGYFIVLDTIGGPGAGPCYTASETFLLTAKSDGGLIKLAEAIAARRPELDAYSRAFHGAYTEQSLSIKVGLKSLAFVNVRRDGVLPNWHQPSDVFANVDPDVLDRTETFVWELLQEIDSAA
jgi:hypothetical protein